MLKSVTFFFKELGHESSSASDCTCKLKTGSGVRPVLTSTFSHLIHASVYGEILYERVAALEVMPLF